MSTIEAVNYEGIEPGDVHHSVEIVHGLSSGLSRNGALVDPLILHIDAYFGAIVEIDDYRLAVICGDSFFPVGC